MTIEDLTLKAPNLLSISRFSCMTFILLMRAACAQEFNIEDDNLSTLPAAALTAVRAHTKTTPYSECAAGNFIGAAVDLTGHGKKMDWVAKTADGCAWGAATAAIWVLRHEGSSYQVVLYSGGQVLSLKAAKPHTLRDLEISSGTAGHYAETYFKFDGTRYRKIKSRKVNLQNSTDCKRNPDFCATSG